MQILLRICRLSTYTEFKAELSFELLPSPYCQINNSTALESQQPMCLCGDRSRMCIMCNSLYLENKKAEGALNQTVRNNSPS